MFAIAPTIGEELEGLFRPALLYASALYYFVLTVFEVVILGFRPSALFSMTELRDQSFGRFWVNCTAAPTPPGQPPAPPAPPAGSAALIPPLLSTLHGRILDLGPGTGTQMPLLAQNMHITSVYGAEPCTGLHPELHAAVAAAGMTQHYTIVSAGAQVDQLVPALAHEGVLGYPGAGGEGVFDGIVTVRVLCSVPDPEETIAGLYRLLRPGGRWVVVEHVVNPWMRPEGSLLARVLQLVYSLAGWSFLVGDCRLQRDTQGYLERVAKKDGGWDLGANLGLDGQPGGLKSGLKFHFGYSSLPYVAGVLVKKK